VVEGSLAARAFGLRRRVVGRSGWRQAAWWGGLGAAPVGLCVALSSLWAAAACFGLSAVLLWLSGFWVGPGSRDGYLRKLSGAWCAWAADIQWSSVVFSRESGKLADRVARLGPPREFEGAHAELVSLLDASKRVTRDRSTPLHERTSQSLTAIAAAEQVSDRLSLAASTPAQQRFAAEISSLLATRAEEFAKAARKAERASDTAVRTITRMHAPTGAREEHIAVVDAFTAYRESACEYYAAIQARQPTRAETAAQHVQRAQAGLRAASKAIQRCLDYEERWPVPSESPEVEAKHRSRA
jgi:hypothetical protein